MVNKASLDLINTDAQFTIESFLLFDMNHPSSKDLLLDTRSLSQFQIKIPLTSRLPLSHQLLARLLFT